jgi:hypothetical protein
MLNTEILNTHMLNTPGKNSWFCFVVGLLTLLLMDSAQARSQLEPQPQTRQIDLVVALDVSNSMDGLIDSAKQRLWDIVNELGRAQPQPDLRIAVLSYGNPGYGNASGYVRIDQPFTRDLDAVNRTLFELTTNGGDEYVARVVDTALHQLDWSQNSDALKVLFVAGNEGAHQDPRIPIPQITGLAASRGIAVNTIYCGGESDSQAMEWREVAVSTNGIYASINQDTAAVANIATPMDEEFVELNKQLNDTYLAFGDEGAQSRKNQLDQDNNVASMSAPAMASRATTKGSALYKADSWDLVDAVKAGKSVDEIAQADLPEEIREMESEERDDYIEQKAKKREEVQQKIQALAGERRQYIKKERAKLADSGEKGLDEVIQEGLQAQAEEKGFSFTTKE